MKTKTSFNLHRRSLEKLGTLLAEMQKHPDANWQSPEGADLLERLTAKNHARYAAADALGRMGAAAAASEPLRQFLTEKLIPLLKSLLLAPQFDAGDATEVVKSPDKRFAVDCRPRANGDWVICLDVRDPALAGSQIVLHLGGRSWSTELKPAKLFPGFVEATMHIPAADLNALPAAAQPRIEVLKEKTESAT
jgi:hypothetical protein